MGIKDVDIIIRGDSISSLTWAQNEQFKGTRVTYALLIFVVLAVTYNIDVKVATHLAGTDNITCDRLSRLAISGDTIEITVAECGLVGAEIINMSEYGHTCHLLSSCDPTREFFGEEDFSDFWCGIKNAVNGLGVSNA